VTAPGLGRCELIQAVATVVERPKQFASCEQSAAVDAFLKLEAGSG